MDAFIDMMHDVLEIKDVNRKAQNLMTDSELRKYENLLKKETRTQSDWSVIMGLFRERNLLSITPEIGTLFQINHAFADDRAVLLYTNVEICKHAMELVSKRYGVQNNFKVSTLRLWEGVEISKCFDRDVYVDYLYTSANKIVCYDHLIDRLACSTVWDS